MGLLNICQNYHELQALHIVYGIEVVLFIKCDIPPLYLAIFLLLDTTNLKQWLVALEQ
jgi:hypothetical protein